MMEEIIISKDSKHCDHSSGLTVIVLMKHEGQTLLRVRSRYWLLLVLVITLIPVFLYVPAL